MAVLLASVPANGPAGRRVRVLFYDDGSVRFRIPDAAPMKISEAFLGGNKESVILKLDPVDPLHLEADAPIIPGHALHTLQSRSRSATTGLTLDEAVDLISRAFEELIGAPTKQTGSPPLGYVGRYEDAPRVHWTAWINVADLTAWLGVTLIGKAFSEWPIARYLIGESRDAQLLEVVKELDLPSAVTFHCWMDAFAAGGARVPSFAEQNITPPDGIRLSELDPSDYGRILDAAMACLDEAKEYRGRAKREITLTTGRKTTLYVAPEFQFRTEFPLSQDPGEVSDAMHGARVLLQPIFDFVLARSEIAVNDSEPLADHFKGEVYARWRAAGRPSWSYADTLSVAERVDDDFARQGLNPAPRFREERTAGNREYLQIWIAGCHFEWLNPR